MSYVTLSFLFAVSLNSQISLAQNGTESSHSLPWQPSPNRRGTLSIVTSCLFTILACTWSVQHLNLPGPVEPPYMKYFRKFKWMAITILFPEYTLTHAILENGMAIRSMQCMANVPGVVLSYPWWYRTYQKWKKSIKDAMQERSRSPDLEQAIKYTGDNRRRYRQSRRSLATKAESDPQSLDTTPEKEAWAKEIETTMVNGMISPGPLRRTPTPNFRAKMLLRTKGSTHRYFVSGARPTDQFQFRRRGFKKAVPFDIPQSDVCVLQISDRGRTAELGVDVPLRWTLMHSYYANMGGLRLVAPGKVPWIMWEHFPRGRRRPVYQSFPLTAKQLAFAMKKKLVRDLPQLTVRDIKDKSRSDFFTKGVAIVQSLQLVFGVCLRGYKRFGISQLEVVTIAFAIVAILTYLFRWYKPQGTETATNVSAAKREFTEEEILALQRLQPNSMRRGVARPGTVWKEYEVMDRIPNDNIQFSESFIQPVGVITALTTIAFGSVHLMAWNFEFPTRVERLLWLAAVFASIGIPLVTLTITGLNWFSIYWDVSRNSPAAFWVTGSLRQATEFLISYVILLDCIHADAFLSPNSAAELQILKRKLPAVKAALEGVEISSVYYCLLDWTPTFKSDVRRAINIMQANKRDHAGPSPVSPLLKWQIEYFWAKIEQGYFRTWHPWTTRARSCVPFNLPEALSHIDEPGEREMTAAQRMTLRTDIVCERRRTMVLGRAWEQSQVLILWITGVTYTMARLSVLVVALLSLRRMPESVYYTTWVKDIPNVH